MNQTTERTAWAIASGAYSDYSVLYIVDGSEADANRICTELGGEHSDYRVEDIEVIPGDVELVPVRRISQCIGVVPSGWRPTEEDSTRQWLPHHAPPELRWEWSQRGFRAQSPEHSWGFLVVEGTDHDRVGKVFSERAAMYRAQPWAQSAQSAR